MLSINKVSDLANILATMAVLIAVVFHYGSKLTVIEMDIQSIQKSIVSIERSLNLISDIDKRLAVVESYSYKGR